MFDSKSDGSPSNRLRLQQLSEAGQRVFQCLSLGLVVFDDQLDIVHHNPAAEFLTRGYVHIADALNAGTLDAQYQDWRHNLSEVINSGRQHRFEQIVFRDANSQELLLNLVCVALTDPSGNHIIGGILVIENVTAVAGMEKRLAVSERMAAVGKLAARVAHELNNPLDGILRYLNLAIRVADGDTHEKITEYLTHARGGLMRMADIIRQLVEFSRSTHTAFGDAGINTIVEEAVKVMSDQAMQNNISIICNLSETVPAIGGTSLFQVFCNLIKNAVDAMPQSGTLTITTQVMERDAVIRFEDTGTGLPQEIERIFEPFFTTKEPGKGTGLGLAICKDIIEKYGGKIVPEHRNGGGSIFTVRIPLESCVRGRRDQSASMSEFKPSSLQLHRE